ncbi:MAG: hypothetical protein MK185_10450 [Saccharospirillaceae bacterium]|nr:hypothetical protein [Saccharospirillaceae bacterium]
MFELLIAISASLLSVTVCYLIWKKSSKFPRSRIVVSAVLLMPLPLWLHTSGIEFGITYFLIAFSLSGVMLTVAGRNRKSVRLTMPVHKHRDTDKIKRRMTKIAWVTAALILPSVTSFLLLMSVPQLMTELNANRIVSSIFLMLLVWPILMIWMVSSDSRFTPSVTLLLLSLIAAVPLIS